ncbi:hypothetical protein ES703_84952 [subsurface metagenome]
MTLAWVWERLRPPRLKARSSTTRARIIRVIILRIRTGAFAKENLMNSKKTAGTNRSTNRYTGLRSDRFIAL